MLLICFSQQLPRSRTNPQRTGPPSRSHHANLRGLRQDAAERVREHQRHRPRHRRHHRQLRRQPKGVGAQGPGTRVCEVHAAQARCRQWVAVSEGA